MSNIVQECYTFNNIVQEYYVVDKRPTVTWQRRQLFCFIRTKLNVAGYISSTVANCPLPENM